MPARPASKKTAKNAVTRAPAPAPQGDAGPQAGGPRRWLLKSEPDCYSIADLAQDGETGWSGVRNYQARNLMRDGMRPGDLALFYHSSAEPPGVAGVCRIAGPARPDPTQFDPHDDHHEPRATPEQPVWLEVPVAFVAAFPRFVTLAELKAQPGLAGLEVLRPGSRLSVQPVGTEHFDLICRLGGWEGP